MSNTKIRKSLLNYEPSRDRMCKLRLKGRFRNVILISAYTPTEDCRDEGKQTFCDQLHRQRGKVPKYDVLMTLTSKLENKTFLNRQQKNILSIRKQVEMVN
jgi:hypothetical protein